MQIQSSIRKKLSWIIVLATSIVSFIGYTLFVNWYIHSQKQQNITLAKELSQTLAQDIAKLILLDNLHSASDLTSALSSFTPVKKVVIYNIDKKPIYKYEAQEKNDTTQYDTFSYTIDASYSERKLGTITFTLQTISYIQLFKRDFFLIFASYLFLLFISYLLATHFARHFTEPLLTLIEFLQSVKATTLNKRVSTNETNEYALLYTYTNDMLDRIEHAQNEQKKAQQESNFLKQYDMLTGLPNKQLFLQRFQSYLNSLEHRYFGSIICFNIRDFKLINDQYGYNTGDLLLAELAQRLKNYFANTKTIAKIGLDEFIICSRNIAHSKQHAQILTQELVQEVLALVKKVFIINQQHIHINIYMGIEIYSNKDHFADTILTKADSALSKAKKEDKEFAFFDIAIEKEMTHYFNLHTDLIYALKKGELVLYYQLQFDKEKNIYGAEALIRWKHPKKGLIAPDLFIPLAEKTGLIIDIGDFVLDQGCKQLEQWNNNLLTRNWILALNISAKQFQADTFIEKLEAVIQRYNFHRNNLKIELTESLLVTDIESVTQKMNHIRSMGIQLSLDDFGTGYSSLQYLKTLPLNQVKIDQNFVMNMLEDKRDFAIIETVIKLGKTFGFEVIAEGVESKEIYEALLQLQCYYFQGYYFAKPQPIEEIAKQYYEH